MSKRNQFIIITPESQSLKRLRHKCDLSLRELSLKMTYSFSRIHQIEAGKENISESYIKKFLKACELSWEEWNIEIGKADESYEKRQKCKELIDQIESSKLELMRSLLENF